jgi:hypothetical protein
VERYYLLRCPVQSGRSSSASFRKLHQRRSSVLHNLIIACGRALIAQEVCVFTHNDFL